MYEHMQVGIESGRVTCETVDLVDPHGPEIRVDTGLNIPTCLLLMPDRQRTGGPLAYIQP